ncbi:DNA polymerase III subunit gamma/tau [Fluviispira multicolorata]|uniref:DNA polymerase III subunit gamma/tau n=1 Tax=Fluviispira multicolorata TaxID=2654512 RepID=A0A833JCT5_9BACT|nr:DNA polymerase III subunit gamma/tau [Fluviispira multicolorata]KAB8027753.1 DNA polymerase III subunit gamma/tau [Fluviispira multicolorata]
MHLENKSPNHVIPSGKGTNYIVLARRTRPQSFSELVGQEDVSKAIESMLSNKKIPHAFLFTGTRGTGKTSSARILAKSLCCQKGPIASPCQTCIHCTQITACAHDDILEIDGASNTGIDNIRELREATRFYPNSARYKVFIIDEVHMLSTGAFNALLKTLEEPPPQVVFILATTELHKVPITVRSRCMIFSFKKIDPDVIAEHLKGILQKENIKYEEDALKMIAREAKGSLRDSLSLLEQIIAICGHSFISAEQTKKGLCLQGEEIAEKIFSSICTQNIGQALELLQQADTASLDIATLIENTAQLFRNSMLIKSLNDKARTLRLTQLLPKEYDFLKDSAENLSIASLSEIFRLLASSVKEISRTNASLAWAEIIVTDCISRAEWLSASEIISLIGNPNTVSGMQNSLPLKSEANLQQMQLKVATETPASISPQKTDTPQNHHIDLNSFKKLVEIAEKKSKTLAARLGFAKIDLFNSKIIQFSDTPENLTYLSFNESDLNYFWESIHEIGFQNADFKGTFTPKPRIIKKSQITEETKPREILKNISEKQINSTKTPNNQQSVAQRFQKYNENISLNTKTESRQATRKAISLSEINTHEKSQDFLQREQVVLEKEHIQQLKKLATEIQITSLD